VQKPIHQHFELVKKLFHGALEQPTDSRLAWLVQACVGDPELVAEVLQLIEIDALSPDAQLTPVTELVDTQILVEKIEALRKSKRSFKA
jgi:hypothetical protein